MAEVRRGLLDTSVVVDHDLIDIDALPEESAISAVTLAELAAGPHAASDDDERVRRQDRLQWVAATWDPLPFDAEAARVPASPTSLSHRLPRRTDYLFIRGTRRVSSASERYLKSLSFEAASGRCGRFVGSVVHCYAQSCNLR